MLSTAEIIRSHTVPEGCIGVTFMGQAGFILKSPSGSLAAIDLYLSDCAMRLAGLKRLMPALMEPEELAFGAVIVTHAHCDHFDFDSIPGLLSAPKSRLYAAVDAAREAKKLGFEKKTTVLRIGEEVSAGDFSILPVECDHGKHTPHAVGLYIKCGKKFVYVAGDTCFRRDIAEKMRAFDINLAIAPINGAFGNMNGHEAAEFFDIVGAGLSVPCHYWNFGEYGGDPGEFIRAMKELCPNRRYTVMRLGETINI